MIDTPFDIPALSIGRNRPLEQEELQRVVREVAERRQLWEHHIDPAATERTYAPLHRDDNVDVWAIFWLPENDTGWHDHDTSSGAVQVVSGTLEESILRVHAPEERRLHERGGGFAFGPTHIHRVTCPSGQAVSIHAYSPPLWRLGQYTVDEDGVLLRASVNYADELRPLDTVSEPALNAAA